MFLCARLIGASRKVVSASSQTPSDICSYDKGMMHFPAVCWLTAYSGCFKSQQLTCQIPVGPVIEHTEVYTLTEKEQTRHLSNGQTSHEHLRKSYYKPQHSMSATQPEIMTNDYTKLLKTRFWSKAGDYKYEENAHRKHLSDTALYLRV